MTISVPSPEMIELPPDWAPWKFQVNTFGNAKSYGHAEDRIIQIGMSNFETRAEAQTFLQKMQQRTASQTDGADPDEHQLTKRM